MDSKFYEGVIYDGWDMRDVKAEKLKFGGMSINEK